MPGRHPSDATEARPARFRVIFLDQLSIDLMGQMAIAFFIFRVSAKLRGRDGPHEPTGRVSMVLKNTPNGWRVIHYHESALAAHPVKTPT